jgi:hypothetical protein
MRTQGKNSGLFLTRAIVIVDAHASRVCYVREEKGKGVLKFEIVQISMP